jgi:hypothetical protein|tara:strand:+ start:1434 stop:1613 length:180 start_codon:yes stop_codon:yes gene_type:complete
MVTSRAEALHILKILGDYMTPRVMSMFISDLDFEVAEITDNESLKQSIKMVREYMIDQL